MIHTAEPNSVLISSNELGKFCFTREHSFSIRQKFQLKIYNAVVSILKIPTNDDLLRLYCHSDLQAKEDGHLRKIQHWKLLVSERFSSWSGHIWNTDSWAFSYTQGAFIFHERAIMKNAQTCIVCMQPWVYQFMNYLGSHVYQNILPDLT